MKNILFLAWLLLSSCATYNYANNVKMISFDEDLTKGKSVGQIRGEDCTWNVLGYWLGGFPTVDRAFINARSGASSMESAGFSSKSGHSADGLRYINNVTTKNDGFHAVVVGKQCIVVTGMGYK